jgi:hypothetical protein
MKHMKYGAIKLLSGLSLVVFLAACGPTTVKEYNAARWVKPDTLLAYIFHHFQVEGSGGSLGRPEYNSYPYSKVTLYQIGLDSNGLHSQTLLYHHGNAVPCGELVYRPEDSLLFFSYLVADGLNGIRRHNCGANDTLKKLALGRLANNRWLPVTNSSLDTAHFLSLLTAGRTVVEPGLVVDSAYERLCANGWCIRTSRR